MRVWLIVILLTPLQFLAGCSIEDTPHTEKPPAVTSQPVEHKDGHTEEEALDVIRNVPGAFVMGTPRTRYIALTGWPDEAITELKYVRHLRRLHICSNKSPISGLAEVAKLDTLVWLGLAGPTSDLGMQELKGMTELEAITLESAKKMTDVGLAVLTQLPRLKKVTLYNCRSVTDAGIDRLKEKGIAVQVTGLD